MSRWSGTTGPGARRGKPIRGVGRGRRRARQRGSALVTVVLVLAALVLLATPFALSMRRLESGALHGWRRESALASAAFALELARRHLEQTHPALDVGSPARDDLAEIGAADLHARHPALLPRDPRGAVRAVTVDDASGRVPLTTASCFLLANLIGGRSRLAVDVPAHAATLPVESSEGFAPAGMAWIGRELVEYSVAAPAALGECRRGWPGLALRGSRAADHARGDDIIDARILLLAQHGWRVRPGAFEVFGRVDGLLDVALYGELAYDGRTLERVRPWLTTHRGGVRWCDAQRIDAADAERGAPSLSVADGSRYGPGTVVQIDGFDAAGRPAREWNLVLEALPWDDGWRLVLLEPPAHRPVPGHSVVAALARDPVNVNTAPMEVLVALLTGVGEAGFVDVVTDAEARGVAAELRRLAALSAPSGRSGAWGGAGAAPGGTGAFSAADLARAARHLDEAGIDPLRVELDELADALVGLRTVRERDPVGAAAARDLAARIRAAAPSSHDELADVLAAAVLDEVCTPGQREALLRCALHPGDARIHGGTAPFGYVSDGTFELRAAASENLPNGKEQARAFARQVVSVAPPGHTARTWRGQQALDGLAHAPGSRGWTTHPVQLERTPPRAPGPGAPPDTIDWGAASAAERSAVPDRAGALLVGDARPSTDADEGFASPAPVRSTLPGTIHFDEGVPGLTGATPRGLSLAAGGASLLAAGLDPPLVDDTGRLLPFSLELWFELDDLGAAEGETILFSAGADPAEDRVLLALIDGALVFRVSDTSIPDFEAELPPGRLPVAGEIRYAFDDGLVLRAGVPYHVLAWTAGARDAALGLLVDGRPRGRRSHTATLTRDAPPVGGPRQSVASYAGNDPLAVDSTAGFPRRGVLVVGSELIEYVDKTDAAFLVPAGARDDPFGGRGRRGTVPAEHAAGAAVELVGYTRPLASETAPGGRGALAASLAASGVAEVDPERALDAISVSAVSSGSTIANDYPVGTGLSATANAIPLRAAGEVPLEAGTFCASGGYALLFCDYGGTALVGAEVPVDNDPSDTYTMPARTTRGWLGGAEVVRYAAFDGATLTGVARNAAGIPDGQPPSELLDATQIATVNGGSDDWSAAREWVTVLDDAVLAASDALPPEPRVLVVPLSIGVDAEALFETFHPAPNGTLGALSPLAQVGLDFEPGAATEWIRWNTATDTDLVRDAAGPLNDLLALLVGAGVWHPDTASVDGELIDDIDAALDFRGQAGTRSGPHAAGVTVLPTLVLGGWGIDAFEPRLGVPGRHDAVTLVSPDGRKEWHRVNHAASNDPEWGERYSLVGLRDEVVDEFVRTPETELEHYALGAEEVERLLAERSGAEGARGADRADGAGASGRLAAGAGDGGDGADGAAGGARELVRRLHVDSRRVTRLVKAPSGELPSAPIEVVHLGRDHAGRPAATARGGPIVDELRFARPSVPGALLPRNARYVLAEELAHEEQGRLLLALSSLLLPHAVLEDAILGPDALEILSELPPGGLLQVGEEIVGYAGLDPVGTGAVFLTDRALYGTPRSAHPPGTPVTPLVAWPASPLRAAVDASDALLPLAHAAPFPADGGLVQVGEELLEYTGVRDGALVMPRAPDRTGLLRGRFGTAPARHGPGDMVRWMPARHADRALGDASGATARDDAVVPGAGASGVARAAAPVRGAAPPAALPEAAALVLEVRAPGAYFTEGAVRAELPDAALALEVHPVWDGDGAAPAVLAAPAERLAWSLARQADALELHLVARWLPGAFDPHAGTAQGWKLAPRVRTLTVGHVQPTLVLEHEEWR